ncbi:uncharacterized protein LOC121255599 isoform X3 [Juglans microcarpa x Juglans regia]|uniref:uncharacterized protein LOC121255599 isoform X3 n=1 Tax=Juglans microcarpa x Juglans regia TaxID=2249226 RepID=UPI001B7EA38D|nr:uncharacterized protein LOC121255599 isoform X3 [Juglans microcarpa x Juglans regia]
MLRGTRIPNLRPYQRPLFSVPPSLRIKFKFTSLSEPQGSRSLDEDSDDFLRWLEQKAGSQISSVLSIGKSAYGRSLFASKTIQTGDCILKVPYSVQVTPAHLLPEIKSLLGNEVGNIAKLAIVILVEQKFGQKSEWAHYVSRLPQPGEMHNMALQCFPELFGDITHKDFMHACALVGSRAWGSSKGLSLIPFADFLNHDGASESIVFSDDDKQVSEVIADRNYHAGEQVLIRYGKFSNATLMLDFGFSLPYNKQDEVQIQFNVPHHDFLREKKIEFLQRHCIPIAKDVNGFNSSVESFTIKEVRSAKGKGKGLPQSLRAFARVLACTTYEELGDLAKEAAQNDGRLARRPLSDRSKEIQAHQMLLSRITQLIEEYNAAIKSLVPISFPPMCETLALRRQMARDLLNGELRILKSASAWLKNYCATLTTFTCNCENISD